MRPTQEQVACFEEQGYLVIEDLIPPDWLHAIQCETTDLHEQMAENPPSGVHVSWEHEVDPSIRRKIKQLMHAEVISPALNRLVRSAEVLDVIEALMSPDISFYHCKLLMKAAGDGTITPWHQDYSYWVDADNRPLMMNCMLQIDASTAENGCLQVVPGSQRKGLMKHDRENKPFGLYLPGYFQPREDAVPVPLATGSAVFFGPLIIHGSDANHSDQDRRAVTVAYNVTGNGRGRAKEVLRGRAA
jgi:ectoine hydroxylase-related dioxygenase (phytanoyl-CoA dioxygenase family)